MAELNSKSDSEQEHRRRGLSAARNGQPTAKAELEKEYHVRVYTEAERSAVHYETMLQKSGLQDGSQPDRPMLSMRPICRLIDFSNSIFQTIVPGHPSAVSAYAQWS
jgi:hypothetical protein